MRALLVDDDHELARLLREYLGPHGVSVDHVEEGASAIERIAKAPEPYDIILLDVMLPGIDGFEVCRRVRARHDVPIVMLTARGDDTDRVVGLELGADDYLPKPFNPRELLARMRAVLRRTHPAQVPATVPPPEVHAPAEPTGPIQVDDLVVDAPALRATLGGRELQLTSFEFRVLVVLARRAGEPVTREELATAVLPKGGRYDPSVDRSLDVHVSHLRQKMGDGPREPRRIRTVRGIGYVLVRKAAEPAPP
jgi:DNA-binding response OmpR family regulator